MILMKVNKTSATEFTFEEAIMRLEELVGKLENGETSLDEALKLFEEGTQLSKLCSRRLTDAEQKITTLSGISGNESINKG